MPVSRRGSAQVMMRILGGGRLCFESSENRTWFRGLLLGLLVVAAIWAARERIEEMGESLGILMRVFGLI